MTLEWGNSHFSGCFSYALGEDGLGEWASLPSKGVCEEIFMRLRIVDSDVVLECSLRAGGAPLFHPESVFPLGAVYFDFWDMN